MTAGAGIPLGLAGRLTQFVPPDFERTVMRSSALEAVLPAGPFRALPEAPHTNAPDAPEIFSKPCRLPKL